MVYCFVKHLWWRRESQNVAVNYANYSIYALKYAEIKNEFEIENIIYLYRLFCIFSIDCTKSQLEVFKFL